MPYKVYKVGSQYCVHKKNPDGSRGRRFGCHPNEAKARAQQKALYASEDKPMSKAKRIKEKTRRDKRRLEIQKEQELEEMDLETEGENLLEDELEEAIELPDEFEKLPEEVKKSYFGGEYGEVAAMGGPLTFEQLDEARAAEEKAHEIREMSWDVQMLVRNIINAPMLEPQEKATYIKAVGNEFGGRVGAIMEKPTEMMKENEDLDLLAIEAVQAQDARNMGMIEKVFSFLHKKELSDQALTDIGLENKEQVRKALGKAADLLKNGDDEAKQAARAALPQIRAAAKKFGVESSMEKSATGIIIQKDAQGDWRWVGWPTNNFKDRSKDILTEDSHKEYVDWWWKNKDGLGFPVFTSMHIPGTVRKYPVDFVGYKNSFLVMSGKLTEAEAAGLLRVQKEYDLGMSHTGYGIRDKKDPRQIVRYRIFEVTDLPVEMADNPFTDLAVLSKEAEMKDQEQLDYLTKLFLSEEKAKKFLEEKTALKQAELQEAGIEQKQAKEPESKETTLQFETLMKQINEELDIDGLNEFVQKASEAMEKVPLLESVIQKQQAEIAKLSQTSDDQLADMLEPKISKKFAWSKERASQSNTTIIEGDELEKAKAKVPGIPDGDDWWLSHATGTQPAAEQTA